VAANVVRETSLENKVPGEPMLFDGFRKCSTHPTATFKMITAGNILAGFALVGIVLIASQMLGPRCGKYRITDDSIEFVMLENYAFGCPLSKIFRRFGSPLSLDRSLSRLSI
jgi:hypothetical protein